MNDSELIAGYLERIGLDQAPEPTPEGLRTLQINHLKHIPFENLDIINGNIPLKLDVDSLYDKLVVRKRGGICYEHNILYAHVLEVLGFSVRRMASHRPMSPCPGEFDHMFLMADFPEIDQTWVTDVGFGYNNLAPIRFVLDEWQSDERDLLLLTQVGNDTYHLLRRTGADVPEEEAEVMYEFNLKSHTDDEYRPQCDIFSTEPGFFTQGPMTSLDELGGRKLLTEDHFHRYDADRNETVIDVPDKETYDRILDEEFGIVL